MVLSMVFPIKNKGKNYLIKIYLTIVLPLQNKGKNNLIKNLPDYGFTYKI